ncbi:phasin family protein [Ectothiorhodospira mobilis]|uniref:phasin family protein n=1 Tax=Ectothiorhodospira mobilis TaxID=195064 RepID=UPI001EE8EA5A|nr:phasin family protein [Ectothiorhodospira mobilis]MCG5535798.1 phasin family protein [Ectothiorhodospira mobilis]
MNELFEPVQKANQSLLDTLRRVGEINQKAMDRFMNQQMDLTTSMVDVSMKQFELMTKAKGYQELMSGQADLARDYGQKLLSSYKGSQDIFNELRESMTQLMDDSVKTAEETVRQATQTSKKAA